MEASIASKLVGALVALTGISGIVILATDQILRQTLGGQHWYGLAVFVIIDFVVSVYVTFRPTRISFTLAGAWAILRIVIQLADIATAPMFQMGYGDFASYLFNPTLMTKPNPPGVPAALIDLILLLELAVVWVAFSGRYATLKVTSRQ